MGRDLSWRNHNLFYSLAICLLSGQGYYSSRMGVHVWVALLCIGHCVRASVRPFVRPSCRPTVRPSDRPSIRPTVRPPDRPSVMQKLEFVIF